MNKVVIKRSVRATGSYAVLGVIVSGLAVILLYQDNLGGWCFVPVAMGLLFAGIGGMLDHSPRIIITDEGLTVRALGQEISWLSIKSVRGEFLPKAGNTIVLELQDGTKQRFFVDVLEVSPQRLYRLIKEKIPEGSE